MLSYEVLPLSVSVPVNIYSLECAWVFPWITVKTYPACSAWFGPSRPAVRGEFKTVARPVDDCGSGVPMENALERVLLSYAEGDARWVSDMTLGEAFLGKGFLLTGDATGIEDARSLKAEKEGTIIWVRG